MSDNLTFSTDLLHYELHMQSVSHLSEQLTLSITSRRAGFCNYLILYVPIGAGPGNLFTRSPAIRSSSPAWSPVGSVPEQEAALLLAATPPPADGQAYQRFIIYNQQPKVAFDSQAANNLVVLTLTGNVNTVDWTANLVCVESSKLNETDAYVPKTGTYPVNKEQGLLVYIDSFVASLAGTGGVAPVTKVRSGQPFRLSWASNGQAYELFQDGIALDVGGPGTEAYGQSGDAVFYDVPAGILSDTTFVLQATGPGEVLYASLTVAVSNPHYSPVLDLKQVLSQADNTVLVNALTATKGAAELAADIRVKDAISRLPYGSKLLIFIWNTRDTALGEHFTLQYVRPDNWYYQSPSQPPPDWSLIITMLQRITYGLRHALLTTSDDWVAKSLKADASPELTTALGPDISDTITDLLALGAPKPDAKPDALKDALKKLDTATLALLFAQADDPKIKLAIKLVSTPNVGFAPESDLDTDHCLRLSNGTPNGNIVLQALTGEKAGLTAINFNGYSGNGEQLFNPAKARYRVGTDQRGATDQFFIDTYSKNDVAPKLAFTILANGNVGIGIPNPGAPLHVKGGVRASIAGGHIGINYFDPGSGWAQTDSGDGFARTIAAYFEGGDLWVSGRIGAGTVNVNSDRRIKHVVGLSDCAADLDLLKKIRVTDYTYIDKLAHTDRAMKKVIAQEIQALLPAAVNTSTQALPNVYEKAARVAWANGRVTVTTAKAHELPATGGKMRLYTPANADVNADATAVDAYTFSFASEETHEAGLFVYGKYVDDFLSVDYDAVAMLNVSATQALAQQVEELHQQNATLHAQLQAQQAESHQTRAALAQLQAQVANLLGQPVAG